MNEFHVVDILFYGNVYVYSLEHFLVLLYAHNIVWCSIAFWYLNCIKEKMHQKETMFKHEKMLKSVWSVKQQKEIKKKYFKRLLIPNEGTMKEDKIG